MLKQLAGQTAIYGRGTIVPRFLNYLLFPYLTRVMTVGEYGVVTDLYALIPFVLVLLTMGLETGYFRFAGKAGSEAEKRTIFSNVWGAVTAVSIVFFVLALLFTPQLARVMEYTDHPSYIRLVAAIVMLNTVTAIPLARLRQQGRAKRFMILRLLFVIVNLALTFFFYSGLPGLAELGICASWYDPQYGAGYVLLADLLANIVLLFALIPDFRDAMPRIRWRQLRTILAYSFPLLVSGIAGVSNQFIDRQMIKYLLPSGISMDALGIYGAVSKLAVIIFLFTQMYRYAAEPYFLSGFKNDDFKRQNAEAQKYFIIVSIFMFLGITLFTNLFALMMGKDFREGVYMLPVILLANIFAGIWLNLSYWYNGARFHARVEPGADSRLGIFRSRARPAGLRNRHGRRQLLPEPETLSRPVRLAPDRDLLPGRRGDLRGVAAHVRATRRAGVHAEPRDAGGFRILCDPSRKNRHERYITLDHQTLTI